MDRLCLAFNWKTYSLMNTFLYTPVVDLIAFKNCLYANCMNSQQ